MLQETHGGDLLHYFGEEMRGSHNLLKQMPSFKFMLLGRNSVPITTLMMWSMSLELAALTKIDDALCHS
jgi:hypothetical protein